MKNLRPKDETCGTCVYWQRTDATRAKDDGECRADPPLLFDDGETGWPRVYAPMWCGHYNNDWHNRFRRDLPEEEPHHGLARAGMK